MKHPTSRQLHAYWDRLRGERAAPERSEIEPGEIRNLLADSFILETDPARRVKTAGKVPPVGDTVDLATATYANTIGAPELATVWTDPDFDPALKAFYYVRVLEIPTPRWVAYDAVRYKVKMGPEVRMKDQERAYTSPIWYTPKG